jgi:hypothetical protein
VQKGKFHVRIKLIETSEEEANEKEKILLKLVLEAALKKSLRERKKNSLHPFEK